MRRFLYSILLVISISYNLFAENKVMYLPHKITSSFLDYTIEYDSLNRIIKEDIVELKDTNPIYLYTNLFSYNEDGLIKQKRSISYATLKDKEQEKPKEEWVDYYYYNLSDSLITGNIERNYKIARFGNILAIEKQPFSFYLDSQNRVFKTLVKSSGISTVTELGYDEYGNIETSEQSYAIPDKNYSFEIKAKVEAFDNHNGIFKDIHFSPHQRTLQIYWDRNSKRRSINNFFSFFATQNSTDVILEIKTNENSKEKIQKENIKIVCSYNEGGYPTSILSKSSNKKIEPDEFKIEYITVKR